MDMRVKNRSREETHLHFKREIFLQVLDDHNQEGQLDPQSLLTITRAGDVDRRNLHVAKVGRGISVFIFSPQSKANIQF